MNTPKTVKRDQNAVRTKNDIQTRTIPSGSYSPGCGDQAISIALADAITNWPFVEDAMVAVLRSLLGGPPEEIASSVFHALIAQNTRLPVMRSLLEDTRANRDRPEVYDDILNEFKRLNSRRNDYVHHYWYTHKETGSVYLCPSKRGSNKALHAGRIVTADELKQFVDACVSLNEIIFESVRFGGAPFPEKPRSAPRRPNRGE